MQTVSVVFSTLHCEGYTADLRYIAGSLLSWSLKSYPPSWKARGTEDSQEKDYSFLGNDTLLNLYDALVYEEKRKRRDKYTSDYFRVNLIENKSDLSKLSAVSEPSIVKFIENQSEQLSKLTLYHLNKKCAIRWSRHARHEPSRILLLFPQAGQTLFVIYVCDSIALRFKPFRRMYEHGRKSL